MRPVVQPGVLVLVAAGGCAGPSPRPPGPAQTEPPHAEDKLGYFVDETAAIVLLDTLSREHRPATVAFEHVAVVDVEHGRVDADRTVVVTGGVIRSISSSSSIDLRALAGAIVFDGHGKYLAPGLVDSHVHTELSTADYLLDLANGVTSVREMNGSPYFLAQREHARRDELLIPDLFVAGPILASRAMGRYATVVTTADQARAIVRQHEEAGYDAIKVHNVVLPEVYAAICDEAKRIGIDVVGHIPHETTVAQAIACPQRTFEHFKGYINDRDLTLRPEDSIGATREAAAHHVEVWNTPTLYNYRDHIRGDEARAILARPEMRYIPARVREQWRRHADEPEKPIQLTVLPMEQKLLREIMAIDGHVLAGTDAGGGYPYEVRGFALHDELALFVAQGMSPAAALRTATVEPARAMRRADAGTIEVGKRADLIVTTANPLDDIENLRELDGVMVRGVWLPRAAIDKILEAIARISAGHAAPTRAEIEQMVTTLETMNARGVALRTHVLAWLRYRLDEIGVATDRPLFAGIVAAAPDDD